jgi:F0F1-type ATP synthase membrane subunit b/b'
MLLSTINLMPDLSLIPLLIIFIFVVLILNFLVFRPALRVLDARKKRSAGELERAKELELAANALDQHMTNELETVRRNGSEARKNKREKAQEKADRMLDRSQRESEEIILRGGAEKERLYQQFKKEFESRIPEMSRIIKDHATLSDEGSS